MINLDENENRKVENIFEALYNDSPIGIELFDSDGKLYNVNSSCMELFGVVNKGDLMGFDLFSDPNLPLEYKLQLKQRKTLRYESTFDFDLVKSHKFYETTKSGKIFIDVLITPLYLENSNKVSKYLVQVQDITESKTVEQKLKDSKEKLQELNKSLEQKAIERAAELKGSEEEFRMLFENANDAIFLHEIDDDNIPGKFIKVNEKACQLYGYNREEMLELTPYDLADPSYLGNLSDIPN